MDSRKKNKLLIISIQPPTPTHGGGQLLLKKLKYLSKYYDLHLITKINDYDEKYTDNFSKYLKKTYIIKKSRFSRNPFYYIFNTIILPHYFIIKEIRNNKFTAINLEYTLTILYFLFLKPFVKCDIVLREVDILYMSIKSKFIANRKIGFINKIKYYFIKFFEITSLNLLADKIIVWGKDDFIELKKYIKTPNKIHIIPPIIEKNAIWKENDSNNFIFIGSNHKPNKESLKHVLKEYWPLIKKYYQSPKLYIIGNINFKSNDRNIINLGYIKDINPSLISSRVLLAPIVWGAGIKVKILDALSAGIPIITNKNGIANIDNFTLNEIICENTSNLSDLIIKYKDSNYLKTISAKEIKFSKNYYPDMVVQKYLSIFND